MKYLIVFPSADLETAEADGLTLGPGGELWFYNWSRKFPLFGPPPSRVLVKAIKAWHSVEPEDD